MNPKDIGIMSSIGENAEFLHRVQAACDQAGKNILQRVAELKDVSPPFAQGNFAEAWHAETFNVDTVLNRIEDVKAHVLKSNGYKSVDIAITDNGQTVNKYSLKYYKNGKASVDAQKGFGDQGRVIPGDQMPEAKDYLDKQIPTDYAKGSENRTENAKELEVIQERLTDRIHHRNAESEPLGRKDAETKFKEAKREDNIIIHPQIDMAKIAEESLRSGAIAAGITISLAVAPRIFNSIVYRCKEGEWQPDTLKSVFDGTASVGAEAGLRGSIATSLTMAAQAGLLGESMRAIDPTIIGTMTYITFEGAKDFTKYSRGEITGEVLADGLMAKSVAATTGAYGAVIGQVIIPIPIVGAMIGAMVGSIAAQNGYRFVNVVTESYFRSEQIKAMTQINVALAKQWNDFLLNYNDWIVRNQYYQAQKAIFIQRAAAFNAINNQLDDKIKQVLEADNE